MGALDPTGTYRGRGSAEQGPRLLHFLRGSGDGPTCRDHFWIRWSDTRPRFFCVLVLWWCRHSEFLRRRKRSFADRRVATIDSDSVQVLAKCLNGADFFVLWSATDIVASGGSASAKLSGLLLSQPLIGSVDNLATRPPADSPQVHVPDDPEDVEVEEDDEGRSPSPGQVIRLVRTDVAVGVVGVTGPDP